MKENNFLQPVTSETIIARKPSKQLKIFVFNDIDGVEEKINDWLMANNVIVQHIGQSQSEKGGRFLFIVSILYYSK